MSNRWKAIGSLVLIGLVAILGGCSSSSPPPSAAGGDGSDPSSEASRGREALNNLKRIGIAFHTYHDDNNVLPTHNGINGKSKLSWRVELLPYFGNKGQPSEEKKLYDQFKLNEAWDSPHNKKLLEKMPDVYRDPRFQTAAEKPTVTYFQGITGKGGVLGVAGGATLTMITNLNGCSNTFLVVEAGTAVPWTKPEDLVYEENKPLPPLGGPKPGPTFPALFCDGHVQYIPTKFPEQSLRGMMQFDNMIPFTLP
jgi:prepilin-type processing-associated H-X9-DG protein